MTDISQFLINHGGPVLFAVVFAEQAGLPLPSAPWLLAAGALSASGKLSPTVAIGLSALAAVLADSLWFYVGRRGGQRVLRLFCRLSLSRNSCVGRTKGIFARHGFQTLVAAKFLPGLGAVMPPLAGAIGIRASRFLLFDGLGSLIYGSFYITVGFFFHNQLSNVMGLLNRVGLSALVLVVAIVSGYITFRYARRRNFARKALRKKMPSSETNLQEGELTHPDGAAAFQVLADVRAKAAGNLQFQNVAMAVTSGPEQVLGTAPAVARSL